MGICDSLVPPSQPVIHVQCGAQLGTILRGINQCTLQNDTQIMASHLMRSWQNILYVLLHNWVDFWEWWVFLYVWQHQPPVIDQTTCCLFIDRQLSITLMYGSRGKMTSQEPHHPWVNTLRPEQNECHFTEGDFWNAFICKAIWLRFKFH